VIDPCFCEKQIKGMAQSGSRKIHLISNEKSGRGGTSSLAEIDSSLCGDFGFDFYNYESKVPGDLAKRIALAVHAAERDGGIVVAAGGDGTIRSVAQEVQARDLVFAIILYLHYI